MTSVPTLAKQDRVTDAILITLCGILQAAAVAIAAFATRDAFAALHSGTGLTNDTLLKLGLSGFVGASFLLASRRRAERLGQSYAIELRHVLYEKIAQLPKSRHDERRVGALALRFVGDLAAARLWFGRGLPDVLTAVVVFPGAAIILFSLSPALALSGFAPLCFVVLIMAATAWHLERRHKTLRQRRASIAIRMIERIAIAPELDVMGRTRKELRALDAQGQSLLKDAVARRGRTAALQSILQAGVAISGVAMLWSAGQYKITPATVAASLSVLALVALPLQDLAAAWDRYCGWRVARAKAQRLLCEPTLVRRSRKTITSASIELRGELDGLPVSFEADASEVGYLTGPQSGQIARHISGLDKSDGLEVLFDGQTIRPKIAHIGDDYIGLQGSLRRSVVLMNRKRPSDEQIADVLVAFGLKDLLASPGGLDQRISENGKGLTADQTLRLDLARAVLGEANVIVIASLRWVANPHQANLLKTLRQQTSATVILAETTNISILAE
ncbi:ABC transporter ATP-binding protein [uncultured Tateyamaria sp.]|uniref:ABC transporter transmembrane domain-containing protein n=1 Tax=uncultured Tateyamaria sp. TaxID=455651 RepID=UPI00263328B3|nr:ABC transporter ATP-binding protein [uncultured Tateyamaria sp.]